MPEEKLSWKDSNLALIGSELDHKVKQAAAGLEPAWKGMGQTAGELKVWRIEKFLVKEWTQVGKFHKGDSYIVMYTYKKGDSEALSHDIHIWIGSESSQDEYGTAAYKMVEADDFLGGTPVQHRQVQGHESEDFLGYFNGGLEYLDGGIESGFRHVEPDEENPVLFQVKGSKKKRTLTQVPLSKSSLNSGDSFILFAGKAKVWCWHGAEAKALEKADCNTFAENMCTMGTTVVLDQGQGDDEDADFWKYLGDGEIQPASAGEDDSTEFTPLLFRVDGDLTKDLEKVAEGSPIQKTSTKCKCFSKSDLKEEDVFLMDTGWEIYVWIGSGADKFEKIAAMFAADKYSKMDPRTLELPVHIVKSGHESDRFLSFLS